MEMIKKTTLPNGLRVITEYMPQTYSATIMIWINAGTNKELPELNGISHFIEHMLFKGTESRTSNKIVQTIESTGGSINAFTEKEYTCYYARVLDSQVTIVVDILLDMIFNSVFDQKNIEIERQVILEEIKMFEDTPDDLVHEILVKSFWKDNPLARPITGTMDSVSSIKRQDILDFVNDFYTPDNIVMSIAGNFNEEEVLAKINDITGPINKTAKIIEVKKPEINSEIIICKKDIEQAHICLGMRGVPVLDNDRYASAIIDVCLGGGMSSRLFQEIREKRGLVYSINTYEALYKPAGIFGVYAGTNPLNTQEVINIIRNELFKIKVHGLSDEEFEQAKVQLKGDMLIGLESTKYRAGKNGRSEFYFNKIFTIEEICEALDGVTQDDINRLSSYIFDDKYTAISLVCPKESAPKELSFTY